MKTFEVTTIVTLTRYDTIEAESIQDAEKKADERFANDPGYECDLGEDFDGVEFVIT